MTPAAAQAGSLVIALVVLAGAAVVGAVFAYGIARADAVIDDIFGPRVEVSPW